MRFLSRRIAVCNIGGFCCFWDWELRGLLSSFPCPQTTECRPLDIQWLIFDSWPCIYTDNLFSFGDLKDFNAASCLAAIYDLIATTDHELHSLPERVIISSWEKPRCSNCWINCWAVDCGETIRAVASAALETNPSNRPVGISSSKPPLFNPVCKQTLAATWSADVVFQAHTSAL